MSNILSSLNATSVDSITQEQINSIMNVHYFIPVLIMFSVLLFTLLSILGLWWKGKPSKGKYYMILFYAFLLDLGLIIICYFFPNSIYQILSTVFNY